MELLIGIAIIFLLLFCLGASVQLIIEIAIGIIFLFVVFMFGVFVYSTIMLVTGKRTKGVYTRAENKYNGKLPYAFYMIEGAEYKNLFPLEVIFQNKIYIPEKEVKLVLNKRIKRCFDGNAVICCIMGIIVSVFLLLCFLIYFKMYSFI